MFDEAKILMEVQTTALLFDRLHPQNYLAPLQTASVRLLLASGAQVESPPSPDKRPYALWTDDEEIHKLLGHA